MSLGVGGRKKKRDPKDAKVDRMLQDYLRYMEDYDVALESKPGRTDPAPPPDFGSVPPNRRPTLPEGFEQDPIPDLDEDAKERRLEREEIEKQRIRSDVRAKRERKTTVKSKKTAPK